MTVADPLAGEELERMFARFARVRLEPSQAQARRARAAVMEAAWRRHLDVAPPPGRVVEPVAARRSHVPFSGWSVRRAGATFAAAIMAGLLVGSSVFASSRAGGPLYESRLALEGLALPANADARVAAQLGHAEARLGEAVEAAFRRDNPATAAALGAYDRTIEDLASADGAAGARALEAVRFHREVLLKIAAQTADAAASGIDIALASSTRVITRLAERNDASNQGGNGPYGAGGLNGEPQGGGNGAGGVNGEPQGGGSGAGGVNGTPQGGTGGQGGQGSGSNSGSGTNAGQDPDSGGGQGPGGGAKPTASPKPQATSQPHPTPRPSKAPRAVATPSPTQDEGQDQGSRRNAP